MGSLATRSTRRRTAMNARLLDGNPSDACPGCLGSLESVRAADVICGAVISVSVLCADLRGFTSLAEETAPRRMALFLNEYLTVMIDVIMACHGMVQDFVGDGILAVFGAPLRDSEHAWHAAV